MMLKLSLLPYVFLGGGLGASLRWFLAMIFLGQGWSLWPATLIVNLVGTLIYFASVKFSGNDLIWQQSFLRYGVLGALTTFSTFSYEVAIAAKNGHWSQAALIFFLNILAGVLIAVGMFR